MTEDRKHSLYLVSCTGSDHEKGRGDFLVVIVDGESTWTLDVTRNLLRTHASECLRGLLEFIGNAESLKASVKIRGGSIVVSYQDVEDNFPAEQMVSLSHVRDKLCTRKGIIYHADNRKNDVDHEHENR